MELTVERVDNERAGSGFPELTALGKRIEMLRIERGLSKQHLARGAGTSRQQLWRVMTGKSELTGTLGQRIAEVLQVDIRTLRGIEIPPPPPGWSTTSAASTGTVEFTIAPATLAEFLADPLHLDRALASLPSDEHGRQLRLALLDAVVVAASRAGIVLTAAHHEIRLRITR